MTTSAISRLRRIHVLLNTLVGERHVRAPLLLEVCDLLEVAGLQRLRSAALDLVSALEGGLEAAEFDHRVRSLRAGLEGATVAPVDAPDALAGGQ